MDLLDRAASWLANTLANHTTTGSGRTTRIAKSGQWVNLLATVGNSQFEMIDRDGQLTRIRTRDFLVNATDLTLDSDQFLPEPGMLLEEKLGTTTWSYEVVAPDGEHAWRYCDHHRHRIRIFTERRGVTTS